MASGSTSVRPPFRADHVGSLLRPAELREARETVLAGRRSMAGLAPLEDAAIRRAVQMQEEVGLHSITDGEFRRTSFHFDFLGRLAGVEARLPGFDQQAAAEPPAGAKVFRPPQLRITGRVRHQQPIELDAFKFLKGATRRTPKVTIPSPTMCLRGGRAAVSPEAYPDLAAFYDDVVAAYRAEIDGLIDAGCTYLQFDDTNFAYLCDPAMRQDLRNRGEDPAAVLDCYIELINAVLEGRPAGVSVAVHICRGNLHGRWAAEGGYEPIAERLFGELAVDGFFLEYDTERAGSFEPLRFVPRGVANKIVLGLVSSKSAVMEDPGMIRRRIEEASRFVPLDRLCLSPQCGFASSFRGNLVAEDVQRRKLERVVQVARDVWGSAQ
ncbi:MAG TPA: 5-methyltetrahydropteroyltriglutamate--homocysteine S-methyltransferase [Hyphomicrobiaceae bacterium]|jgi:5-methyltetrahydropteroyltriglutamate--homocysteine methyltransferase|nr:5-methyltetrahydropteroyltriglutamate--homocysteine S-methyltransferase [Hyphomicrobiaceae bacterium]